MSALIVCCCDDNQRGPYIGAPSTSGVRMKADHYLLDLSAHTPELVEDVREWTDAIGLQRSTLMWVPESAVQDAYIQGVDPDDLYRLHNCVAAILFEELSDDGTVEHEVTFYTSRADAEFAWDAMLANMIGPELAAYYSAAFDTANDATVSQPVNQYI